MFTPVKRSADNVIMCVSMNILMLSNRSPVLVKYVTERVWRDPASKLKCCRNTVLRNCELYPREFPVWS